VPGVTRATSPSVALLPDGGLVALRDQPAANSYT